MNIAMFPFLLVLIWSLSSYPIIAQQDSLYLQDHSDTILIQQDRLPDFGQGHNYTHLNSKALQHYRSRNLAEVLQLESTLFVKNYGPNGISTLSGRGGGASHTAVLWEGFNIQSPMLGQADISLLPASFVDQITIQYGGESALFGNSSIGGAIYLNTQSKFNKQWQFSGNIHGGSFENWGQELKLSYSNHWYAGSIRTQYRSATNNYLFKDVNAFGTPKPIKLQNNSKLKQFGLLQEHIFKIKQHQIGVKNWYQNSFRQIPPTLLQDSSKDHQKDASLRSVVHWKWFTNQHVFQAKSALFLESLQFINDAINSNSRNLSSITEWNHKWYINDHHRLHWGLNYSFFTALSSGYQQTPQQHRAALFAAYRISTKHKKWHTNISIREEIIDGKPIVPAVSLGSFWSFYKQWQLKIHLSHNYRLPTFNDLYWNTLGNPDLVPEYSWNSELGIHLPFDWSKYALKTSLTGFCNLVNNWILWSPNSAGLWRPDNIDQVLARGMELNVSFGAKWNKWGLSAQGNYAYTLSTRTKAKEASTIGKQLIYTPFHNANGSISIQYHRTKLRYQHSFTAARFVDNLNTVSLPFFHVGHLRLEQQVIVQKASLNIYFQLNNLWGEDYQIVSQRPMPWQQIELGLQLDIGQ